MNLPLIDSFEDFDPLEYAKNVHKVAQFGLICPLGLESSALKELEEKCEQIEILSYKKNTGTIEFKAPLSEILNKMYHLQCANHLHLRLKVRKAKDYQKQFHHMKSYPWGALLAHQGLALEFKYAHQKSPLIHDQKVYRYFQKALDQYKRAHLLENDEKLKSQDLEEYPKQALLARQLEDTFTLSLRLNTRPLYRRNTQHVKGHASLRESIASCILYELKETYQLCDVVIDPMCGTGTFLKEIFHLSHSRTRTPTDAFKHLRFLKSFHPKAHIESLSLWPKKTLKGYDLLNLTPQEKEFDFQQQDFFSLTPGSPLEEKKIFIISNPPYGKRITLPFKSYFKKLINQYLRLYPNQSIFLILPREVNSKHIKVHMELMNQGIPVALCEILSGPK